MPRPDDKSLIDDLDLRAENTMENPAPDLAYMRYLTGEARVRMKEVLMSGEWLWGRLLEAGASQQEAHDVCFAHGQRCFGRFDFWEVADQCYNRWKDGNPDVPGRILAEEITAEIFGDFARMNQQRDGRRKELHTKYTRFLE